jgi:hypothetical protein
VAAFDRDRASRTVLERIQRVSAVHGQALLYARPVARPVTSDRRQRLGFGHGSAQRTVFVQVAEHLDADGLVQAADADRFVAAGADQVSD